MPCTGKITPMLNDITQWGRNQLVAQGYRGAVPIRCRVLSWNKLVLQNYILSWFIACDWKHNLVFHKNYHLHKETLIRINGFQQVKFVRGTWVIQTFKMLGKKSNVSDESCPAKEFEVLGGERYRFAFKITVYVWV